MGKCLRENHRDPYMTTNEIAVGLSVFFSANSIVEMVVYSYYLSNKVQ